MKLRDLRGRLRVGETPAPPMRVLGMDLAAPDDGDRSGVQVLWRRADGTVEMLGLYLTEHVEELHKTSLDPCSYLDDLSAEIIEDTLDGQEAVMGQNFLDRLARPPGALRTWAPGEHFGAAQLERIFGAYTVRTWADDGATHSKLETTFWMVWAPNAFQAPRLCRYVTNFMAKGEPHLIVATGIPSWTERASRGDSGRGHAAGFYPAATRPCSTCEQTGILKADGPGADLVRGGFASGARCPACNGLSRVWVHAPMARPDSAVPEGRRPVHFAEANPARWVRGGI